MKKLSFLLMAMLISVMSFAETELFTQTYPGSPSSYTNAYTKSFTVTTGDYTLTYTNINNGQASNAWTAIRSGSKNGASVATIASEQIAAPIAKVVINFTQANASLTNALYLEVSANSDFSSATKIAADIAVGNVEFPIAAPAANQYYKITIDQAKGGSANGFNRFDKVVFYQGEAAGEDVEIVAAPEFSVTEANFTTAFTLDITSEEGTTLKYTIDNTDPSTSATAIEVATNSTSVQITKSTAVKAIAIKGELKSVTKSKVYCYVNSAETAYTVAEAMEVIDAGLGLANELYVKGEISTIEKYDANYGSITYWIKDEEGNKFECYSGLGLNKAKFTSKEDVEVGASVVACGVMKLFVTSSGDKIYEFNYNNYLVEYVAPVVSYVVTVSANPAEAGTVTGAGEYEEGTEATLTATANEGYEFVNWTENEVEVSTDAEYTFEVLADRALVANFKEAEPEGIEVVLENAYKEVYLVWNRANFFGKHATYGDISVQVNNYNGYGTYAEGVSSRIDGVNVNGSATFENKGETDLLTATLTDAEGTVYIIKAEVPTPKTYEVVATNATYVNVDQGWTAELTVNGLTVGEEELTLKVYWDGVGGSEEGYEASAGFEGSLQGMILVDKGEGDVLSFEGTLKDASDNSYIFDFEATPKAAETYTLTFEEMVIEPGQWDDHLHITAENTEYAIEFQLFGGKTKGYGEYGFTDDYPDVDEIYINSEYATMAKGTVANYYLNEETSLATIELTVVLGIDIYNITLTGQPLVNPEDIEPTDTINIAMTKATIGLYMGMPKVAASSEEADLSIVLVGENPYKATVEDFSASSYLVTTAGSLTFLRGGLEIVEVGDVKIAYIGVLCSDHKWYNITLTTGTELPTALENLDTTVAPAKAIVNGQLVIIKNGVQYNAQGAVVK